MALCFPLPGQTWAWGSRTWNPPSVGPGVALHHQHPWLIIIIINLSILVFVLPAVSWAGGGLASRFSLASMHPLLIRPWLIRSGPGSSGQALAHQALAHQALAHPGPPWCLVSAPIITILQHTGTNPTSANRESKHTQCCLKTKNDKPAPCRSLLILPAQAPAAL